MIGTLACLLQTFQETRWALRDTLYTLILTQTFTHTGTNLHTHTNLDLHTHYNTQTTLHSTKSIPYIPTPLPEIQLESGIFE